MLPARKALYHFCFACLSGASVASVLTISYCFYRPIIYGEIVVLTLYAYHCGMCYCQLMQPSEDCHMVIKINSL